MSGRADPARPALEDLPSLTLPPDEGSIELNVDCARVTGSTAGW